MRVIFFLLLSFSLQAQWYPGNLQGSPSFPGTQKRTPLNNLERAPGAGYVILSDTFGNLRIADFVIIDTSIVSTPTAFNNPGPWSRFVKDSLGDLYFIDWKGKSLKFGSGAPGPSCGICPDSLPYYHGDTEAIANGLLPGDTYLLECNNDYGLPAGIYKVVKNCAFDCDGNILFFPNDAIAYASGVPIGREYALSGTNIFGLLYGFIKTVASDTLTNDSLVCSTVLPFYDNDVSALLGSLTFGDPYNMSQTNTYGASWGMHRVVSSIASTSADSPICCDEDATLKYFNNDIDAISNGLVSGNYYYLKPTNTYGFPWGIKKVIP